MYLIIMDVRCGNLIGSSISCFTLKKIQKDETRIQGLKPKLYLFFSLFLLSISPPMFSQNIIFVDTNFVQLNAEKEIKIFIDNQDVFVSFQVDIPLDEDITYLPGSVALNPQRVNGHLISASLINGNLLRIFAYSFSNSLFNGNSGWVANFTISAGPVSDAYPLEIQNGIIGNQNSQNILTGTSDGILFVIGPISLSPYADPEYACEGESIQLFANPDGGTTNMVFSWSSNPPGFQSNLQNPFVWPQENTTYFVQAVDMFETVSGQLSIELMDEVLVSEQPQSVNVLQGASAVLCVSANGSNPLQYQWYGPNGFLPEESNDTLFLPNVQMNDSGYYHCEISNACNTSISDSAKLTVTQTVFIQTLNFSEGWNSISFAYQPVNPEIETIFQSVLPRVILISDGNGLFYPEQSINTLGNWNYQKGYFIKMEGGASLLFEGSSVATKNISLKPGWNLIPVLSENEVRLNQLYNQLGENLVILKEMIGHKVFWPDKQIYSLTMLLPGKAYQIKVENAQIISY